MDYREKVIKILAEVLEKSEDDIQNMGSFSDMDINSLNFIKIIVLLEDMFEIEFDDNYLSYEKFSTIDSMVDYIKSLK